MFPHRFPHQHTPITPAQLTRGNQGTASTGKSTELTPLLQETCSSSHNSAHLSTPAERQSSQSRAARTFCSQLPSLDSHPPPSYADTHPPLHWRSVQSSILSLFRHWDHTVCFHAQAQVRL